MEFSILAQRRRSVRKYECPAPRPQIERILKEAQQAPSWKNMQTTRYYVVDSPETLEAFRAAILPQGNKEKSENAALIVTTFVKDQVGFSEGQPVNDAGNFWGAYDSGLASAYLCLAASNEGFDTLIMGIRDAEAIRKCLSIPGDEQIMAVIAIGKRAEEPAMRPRKPLSEVAKFF
jgi:nitroreductase